MNSKWNSESQTLAVLDHSRFDQRAASIAWGATWSALLIGLAARPSCTVDR